MENKKSGKLKWIIIVVIVIAIIGAAMSGGDDEKKKSEDTKKESTETVDTKEEEKSEHRGIKMNKKKNAKIKTRIIASLASRLTTIDL